MNLDGVAEKALELDANRIVVIDRGRMEPGRIKLFNIGPSGAIPVPPLIHVADLRLKREIDAKRRYVQSFVLTTESDLSETTRLAECFSDFFNITRLPIDAAFRHRSSLHISLNASHRIQITFMLIPNIEIGPRIAISKLVW